LHETILNHEMPGYFETQVANFCAVQASNNMLQCRVFSPESFFDTSKNLTKIDNLTHHTKSGYFDTDTIYAALECFGLSCNLLNVRDIEDKLKSKEPFMIIVTHESHHFSARRFNANDVIWIFDSLTSGPVKDSLIEEETLFFNILRHFKEGHIQRAPQVVSVQKGVDFNDEGYKEVEFIQSNDVHSLSNSVFSDVKKEPFPSI
jgi:hypothetical protein